MFLRFLISNRDKFSQFYNILIFIFSTAKLKTKQLGLKENRKYLEVAMQQQK